MGDQSPIVESWEGDIFAKLLQPRVVGDAHFSEFDEPAERHYVIPGPLEQFARHWVHYMSTKIEFAYPASVAYHLPLLPASTLCIQRAFRASLNWQSSYFELSDQHYNTNAFTSVSLIIPCSIEGSWEEKILLSGMPNVYMRNPFFSGVPTAAMIGALMRLQTLIKAWPTAAPRCPARLCARAKMRVWRSVEGRKQFSDSELRILNHSLFNHNGYFLSNLLS